jgi:hypothetical protein
MDRACFERVKSSRLSMNMTACKRIVLGGMVALFLTALASANPEIAGRWRLDPARSSALDGWNAMDLIFVLDGSQIAITHEMRWRSTNYRATNTVDSTKSVASDNFFRVEQRHMAVYPTKGGVTHTIAEWIDKGRTLRTESNTPVEVSQGDVNMRITSEYRIGEAGENLTLIELHSSRGRPLVYVFNKVKPGDAK